MEGQRDTADFSAAMRELRVWLKLVYWGSVRSRIEGILDDEKKMLAYEATDGSATTRNIARLVGVDQKTISRWWREWIREGIAEPEPERADRPVKLISLREFRLV